MSGLPDYTAWGLAGLLLCAALLLLRRPLAQLIREAAPPRELIIAPHEPFTGAHVGPGMLALFFHGRKRTEM